MVYSGSLVYNKQGGAYSLESASFTGGRFVATNTGFMPHYFVTDHLGSVRAIVNDEKVAEIRNDYYPFGGRWNAGATSDNRYQFNGKESQAFVDLPHLDYGARRYDPNVVIWGGIDPLAEITPSISPYAFCNNNPLRYVDHFGLSAQDTVVNIPPVVVAAKRKEQETPGISLWLSPISLGITINHKSINDMAKNGLYMGSYNGIMKEYSNRFYGNKQISKTMVATQKANFVKKLKLLTKLKGIFTLVGAKDMLGKAKDAFNKIRSGEDVSNEELYSLVSAAVSFAGWQGASLSVMTDFQQLSTQNALNILEETGDQELFIRIIQPGPRNF